jgi:hypothetical protein
LALYGDNFNTMLKVFVGFKKDPFALCIMQVDGTSGPRRTIETNYPNSLEGVQGLFDIAKREGMNKRLKSKREGTYEMSFGGGTARAN